MSRRGPEKVKDAMLCFVKEDHPDWWPTLDPTFSSVDHKNSMSELKWGKKNPPIIRQMKTLNISGIFLDRFTSGHKYPVLWDNVGSAMSATNVGT